MIELKSISKIYQVGNHSLSALNEITVSIQPRSFLGIRGPSGSGKSTLLNIIGLIDTPSAGEYLINSKTVSTKSVHERALLRKKYFGFVFQDFNLIPELDIYHNVELPLLINNVRAKERKAKVHKIIDELGLVNWMRHRPFELSGGQQQRVSIARALVKEPSVVLADEPTANLDSNTALQVVDIMKEMNTRYGTMFIVSSHDDIVIQRMDTVIELKDGCINEK